MRKISKLSDSLKSIFKEKITVYVSVAALFALTCGLTGFAMFNSDNPEMNDFVYALAEPVLPERQYDVSITVDGKTTTVTGNGTVGDILEQADIKVSDEDLINIGFNEPVNNDTDIVINRVVTLEKVSVETINYTTQYKEDPNAIMGFSHVLVDGEDGEKEVKTKHTYIDGELVSKEILSEKITDPAVDKVVLKGTGTENAGIPASTVNQVSWLECPDDIYLDENNQPLKYKAVYTGKATAYSAKPGAGTASGRKAQVGYVAVDPNLIPYGTKLYIVSTDGKTVYGYAIAADTGTGLLEGIVMVDVFMESYEASCQWGAVHANMYVLE